MSNFKKGYIALSRSVRNADWAKCAIKRTLWENLLLDASYKSRTVNFKGTDWNLSRGQLVTTREILANQIEIGGKPVNSTIIRRALEFFENQGMISKSGNRLGTVITIINYDAYQSYFCDQSNDQKIDQPDDQYQASNIKALDVVNDQPNDQSNDQKIDQQNNKVLEQESNNKNNMSSDDDQSAQKIKNSIDFDLVMDAYNDAVENRLPQIQKMTTARKNAVKKLLKELEQPTFQNLANYFYDFVDHAKPFYFGENDRGWRADFDYIIKPSTYLKVVEGTL
ncbi:MAG: replication protein [Gilliamella sp.]|nr:replication protein [Gilliamella sp.]